MGMVVPKVRKHLCADALLRSIQDVFSHIPDHRKGDAEIPLGDALMSAFAMFSLKSPSLLAFDKVRAEDNLQSIYGMGRVPCDTSMRELLDPVEPEHVRPAFKMVLRHLQRGKALEAMVFVEGHYLLALDGTGYFSSQEIHCESCLETHHRNGTVTYSHQLLGGRPSSTPTSAKSFLSCPSRLSNRMAARKMTANAMLPSASSPSFAEITPTSR